MSYTYRLHPKTKDDYAEAYEWYEDKQKGLGERFIKAVRYKIEQVCINPEVCSSKGNKNYREALVDFFPFLIVYKVYKRKGEIFISSIHHAKNISEKNIENKISTELEHVNDIFEALGS
jgi:plasmid stabilization system protein ParE